MDSSRCSSCSASIPTPRPDACPYCGTLLPAIAAAAPSRGAGRVEEAMRLPREPSMLPPQRRSAAGFFAVLVLVALLLLFFMMFTGVRVEPAPPPTPAAAPASGR